MYISRIQVSNFKSFKSLDISLQDYNMVIGANASGKSNFTQIFEFLRDISVEGLANAISLQGGAEYLLNSQIGIDQELSIGLVFCKRSFCIKSSRKLNNDRPAIQIAYRQLPGR